MTNPINHNWIDATAEAYIAGGLSPDERASFEAHIAACQDCAALLAARRAEDDRLQAMFDAVQPEPDFENRIANAIKERLMKPAILTTKTRRYASAAAAVLILGTTGALANYLVDRDALPSPIAEAAPDNRMLLSPVSITMSPSSASESFAATRLNARLNSVIQPGELTANNQSLEKVLNYVSEQNNVNMIVDWNTLKLAGIDKSTPLDINLRDVSLRTAIDTALASVNATSPLGFTNFDGVIHISTKDDLAKNMHATVPIYDVRDLPASTPISYNDLLLYPDNWPELSRSHQASAIATANAAHSDNIATHHWSTPTNWPILDNLGVIDELPTSKSFIAKSDPARPNPPLALVTQDAETVPGHSLEEIRDLRVRGFANVQSDRVSSSVAQNERDTQVHKLVDEAKQAYDVQRYDQAKSVLQQAQNIDPRNQTIASSLQQVEDKEKWQQWQNVHVRRSDETQQLQVNNYESAIPGSPNSTYAGGNAEATDVRLYADDTNGPREKNLGELEKGIVVQQPGGNSSTGGEHKKEADSTLLVAGKSAASLDPTASDVYWRPIVQSPAEVNRTSDGKARTTTNGTTSDAPADGPAVFTFAAAKTIEQSDSNFALRFVAVHEDSSSGLIHSQLPGSPALEKDRDKLLAEATNLATPVRAELIRDPANSQEIEQNAKKLDASKSDTAFYARRPDHADQIWQEAGSSPATFIAQPAPSATRPSSATTSDPQPPADQKIIRRGNITIEVKSFLDAAEALSRAVAAQQGYIASSTSTQLPNGKVQGTVTVRVLPNRVEAVVAALRTIGEVKNLQVVAEDVGKEYTDTESELRALSAMEQRLLDLIKNGHGEVKDLVIAEQQLGEYRVRIEKLQGQLNFYKNQIGMATLTVDLTEKDIKAAASVTETENINTTLIAEDVEPAYAKIRRAVEDAKGRILSGNLQTQDQDRVEAVITAAVPPDQVDAITTLLRVSGTVIQFDKTKAQSTPGGEAQTTGATVDRKDTTFNIRLYNLAAITPKETYVLTLAVPNVEDAFKAIQALVKGGGTVTDDHTADHLELAKASLNRISTANLQGQRPEEMTADLEFQIRAADTPDAHKAILAMGEIMTASTGMGPPNATAAKTGFRIRLVAIPNVAARQNIGMNGVVDHVAAAAASLQAAVQSLKNPATRIVQVQINQQDSHNITASLEFDINKNDVLAIEKSLADAGIDITARNTSRNPDLNNTLDSKIHYSLAISSAEMLPPRRSTNIVIETEDVKAALEQVRVAAENAGAPIGSVTYNTNTDGGNGARLQLDAPTKAAESIFRAIDAIQGQKKSNEVGENPQVETRYTRERIQLTLQTPILLPPHRITAIVQETDDVAAALAQVRAAAAEAQATVTDVASVTDGGHSKARIQFDVPSKSADTILRAIDSLKGQRKSNDITESQQPPSAYSRQRIDLILATPASLVPAENGFGSSLRKGFFGGLTNLLRALQYVVMGLVIALPFLLILGITVKMFRRRKV